MTDRYNSFLVSLKHDMRSDDAESLMNAISMLYNVEKVTPNVSEHFAEYTYHARFKREISELIREYLDKPL